jgi:hypothetical protein
MITNKSEKDGYAGEDGGVSLLFSIFFELNKGFKGSGR